MASPDMTAILLVGTHFIKTSVSFPYIKCEVRTVSRATEKFSWSKYLSSLRLKLVKIS